MSDKAKTDDQVRRSATGRHAMVQREGYSVPLIGIPPDAVLEKCDCCHEQLGLSKLKWDGKQMLCAKCESPNDRTERPALPKL